MYIPNLSVVCFFICLSYFIFDCALLLFCAQAWHGKTLSSRINSIFFCSLHWRNLSSYNKITTTHFKQIRFWWKNVIKFRGKVYSNFFKFVQQLFFLSEAWNLSLILACFKPFLIAWPTVLCSGLLPILLWFVHRLGLFSRLFTSGGIVLSRCLESTQDCSPLCTPWTYAVNKYLIHSLFIWVASGWLWQNDDNVLGELSH